MLGYLVSTMYIKLFTFPIMTATQSPCLRAVYQSGKHNNTTQICLTLIWISCLFHSPLAKHSKALWYPVNNSSEAKSRGCIYYFRAKIMRYQSALSPSTLCILFYILFLGLKYFVPQNATKGKVRIFFRGFSFKINFF